MFYNKRFEKILDFIFPKQCLGCQKSSFYLCPNCWESIPKIDKFTCPICHSLSYLGQICCRKNFPFRGLIYIVDYNNSLIQKTIKFGKFKKVKEVWENLGNYLGKFLKNNPGIQNLILDQAYLLPIPLDNQKLFERGFNQAEVLAQKISYQFGNKVLKNFLIKNKRTKDQAKLKPEERLINLKNAFSINKDEKISDIKEKKIILIDDVYTTGSTILNAAKIIKQAKPKEIWAITLAKTE